MSAPGTQPVPKLAEARQVTLRSPSAVAVHDDRDMRRQLVEVHGARQSFVGRAGRKPRQQLIKGHGLCAGARVNCSASASAVP